VINLKNTYLQVVYKPLYLIAQVLTEYAKKRSITSSHVAGQDLLPTICFTSQDGFLLQF
jgi:hypothetical protein